MSNTADGRFAALRDAIVSAPPLSMGVLPLPKQNFVLYYGKGDDIRRANLADATPAELDHLSQTCEAATFGRNNQDVLDESYRKAGKLDSDTFAIGLGDVIPHLLERIRPDLLEGTDGDKKLVGELYKLNVYGKGAFFKPHKDTPRSSNMVASLVLVFPTPHEGGALTFRHEGKEWSFESGARLATPPASAEEANLGYAAFFSDIEHEVFEVTSGHRVTITYNLYLGDTETSAAIIDGGRVSGTSAEDNIRAGALKAAIKSVIDDATLLPKGGYLGFGLAHQYPLDKKASSLQNVVFKGRDAVLERALRAAGLQPSSRIIYDQEEYGKIMLPSVFHGDYETEDLVSDMLEYYDGIVVESGDPEYETKATVEMCWVTPLSTFSKVGSEYIAYGNQASLSTIYGNICLVVEIERGNQADPAAGSSDENSEEGE